jgi:hypothetical protein
LELLKRLGDAGVVQTLDHHHGGFGRHEGADVRKYERGSLIFCVWSSFQLQYGNDEGTVARQVFDRTDGFPDI